MVAAYWGYIEDLPNHWLHNPTLRDVCGRTVAMNAAGWGYIKDLPFHWLHNPTIRDDRGDTVADILKRCGYEIPI